MSETNNYEITYPFYIIMLFYLIFYAFLLYPIIWEIFPIKLTVLWENFPKEIHNV